VVVDLGDYASTLFGEPRRTPGHHGYVAYFPSPIPRTVELPAPTVRLLADAEASLGRLAGVGQLLPNPHLLIRPYLLREALSSTRIEGTQASLADVFEAEASGEPPSADVEERPATPSRWSTSYARRRSSPRAPSRPAWA
jgi:hypothetical protein